MNTRHDGDPLADVMRHATRLVYGLGVAERILAHRQDQPIAVTAPHAERGGRYGHTVAQRTAALLLGPGRCYTELAVDGTGICVAAHRRRDTVYSPAAWHLPYPQAGIEGDAFMERLEYAVGEATLLVAMAVGV